MGMLDTLFKNETLMNAALGKLKGTMQENGVKVALVQFGDDGKLKVGMFPTELTEKGLGMVTITQEGVESYEPGAVVYNAAQIDTLVDMAKNWQTVQDGHNVVMTRAQFEYLYEWAHKGTDHSSDPNLPDWNDRSKELESIYTAVTGQNPENGEYTV